MAYLLDDASNEYLEWANSGTPTIFYPITVAAWLRPDALNITSIPLSFADAGAASSFNLIIRNARLGGQTSNAFGTIGEATTTLDMTVNTWHHGCFVSANATSRTAYLDGGNSGADTTNVVENFAANRVGVGRLSSAFAGYYHSGRIAEAAVWFAILTAGEIAALAAGYSPALIRPNLLYFYAPIVRELTERTGKTLTAYNTPTVADHVRVINPSRIHVGENTYVAPAATGQPTALRDWVRHVGRPWRPQRGL